MPDTGGRTAGRFPRAGAAGGPAARRWGVTAGAAVLAVVAAGCGIRTTSVPVDAGGAPSRVPCSLSEATARSTAPGAGVPARVYLVCASGLEPVERTVPPGGGVPGGASRAATAQALLDAIRERPSQDERQAGFTTYLEEPLAVSAGRAGDPESALRLSLRPEELPPVALAQIVCTYGETDATSVHGAVVLGGPGREPVRRYVCDEGVKDRPEAPVPTRAP
ncbi:hypothetical protein [Streptomyces somaliensis]|uniref:hypothetical protein n=1 Tax=Streptomyces somaliensis TaxID=78355 RepID=UPI0028152ADC|nr:hypothetical protein [Streptomyces somaliensis]